MALSVEMVAWIILTACLSTDYVRASVKKGGAVGPWHYLCDDLKVMNNISWWYDWGSNIQKISDKSGCKNIQQYEHSFIPMIWGNDSLQNASIYEQAQFVLGFNEPNHMDQSNLTARQAAELWPEVEKIAKGKLLVSPSAAGCGGPRCHGDVYEWFDEFFRLCTDCRIDYIATHKYSCDPDDMMGYLKTVHNRYGKKIWLTEFACPNVTDPKRELQFLKAVLPRLEAASHVFRYSWFEFRILPSRQEYVTNAASLLQPNTSELTTLGQFYNTYTYHGETHNGGFLSKVILVVHYMFTFFKNLIF